LSVAGLLGPGFGACSLHDRTVRLKASFKERQDMSAKLENAALALALAGRNNGADFMSFKKQPLRQAS
jgi:hypothetical protein